MKHYEIKAWAIALKMMLVFRRGLLAQKKDVCRRMDAVQFKVFLVAILHSPWPLS